MSDYRHQARVFLAQARHFRQREKAAGWSGGWSAFLLECAARARRDAISTEQVKRGTPNQGVLF